MRETQFQSSSVKDALECLKGVGDGLEARGSPDLPSLDRMRHGDFPQQHKFRDTLMRDDQFDNFIIFTMIMPPLHDAGCA